MFQMVAGNMQVRVMVSFQVRTGGDYVSTAVSQWCPGKVLLWMDC